MDVAGNTPLAYAVLGKHDGCATMLLQKGANVNVNVYPCAKTTQITTARQHKERHRPLLYKYLPSHLMNDADFAIESYTLFEGIIKNGWLGLTYLALDEMERFGMSYARAIEVAFHLSKLQFAKTLINKQVKTSKLLHKVSNERNLICALAFEMNRENYRNKER